MKKITRLGLLLLLLTAFSGSALRAQEVPTAEVVLPHYTEATLTPRWADGSDEDVSNRHRVGSFKLSNQDGQTVCEEDFSGLIRVVSFFFTSCPGICSTMSTNLGLVQEAFNDDRTVRLVSFSVMPKVDTVSVLHDYAESYAVRSGKWDLLTGDRKSIYQLARRSYFAETEMSGSNEDQGIIHSEKLLLVDGAGHIRGVYNGTLAFDMRRLIEDVRILKRES